MPRIFRAALAVTVSIAAAMIPSLAHAERWEGTDPREDVSGLQLLVEPLPCGEVVDVDGSADTNEDITRLRVRHSRAHVTMRARFRDLDPALEQMVTFHIGTDSGPMMLDIGRWQKRDGTFGLRSFLGRTPEDPGPEDLDECGGFTYMVAGLRCGPRPVLDFERDTVTASLPRRCLDDPRWVRVGVDAARFVEDGAGDFTVFFDQWGDDADDHSLIMPPLGPRVTAPRGASLHQTAGIARRSVRMHSFDGLRYRSSHE